MHASGGSVGFFGTFPPGYGALFWPMPEAPIDSAAPAAEPKPIAPIPSAQVELRLETDPIAPPPADPALQTPPTGQLLLGTDKRNPVIGDVVGKVEGTKGTIKISTRQDDPWVEIRISDTGTGIPETIRDRIFDPFFTTKGVGKGTGQSLAIARSTVVDKHGGQLSFESKIGQGTGVHGA